MTDDYDEKSFEIRKLASLPVNDLTQHLSDTHNTLDQTAPNLAPHVFSTAVNAINFLNQRLPPFGSELPEDKLKGPSPMERKAWLDLHAIVNDPLLLLEHTKNKTLTSHQIEAVKAVYPDIYGEIVNKTVEKLGETSLQGKQLPYGRRIAIAKLLGMPLDATMTSESLQAIISSSSVNTGPEASQMRQGAEKTSGPALTQMNRVNQGFKTAAQQGESADKQK